MIDEDTGKIVASEVELADSFWRRFCGLMFRRRFPPGKALFFEFDRLERHEAHMFFMRFPIDLVYLNEDFRVVEIHAQLKPWRMHWPKADAKYSIELPTGTTKQLRIEVGHKILLEHQNEG